MRKSKFRCLRCGKEEWAEGQVAMPAGWLHVEQQAPLVAWANYFCSIDCLAIHTGCREAINGLRKIAGLYREYGNAQL